MNKKISTFDEGLEYLSRAKKEYAHNFFARTKLDAVGKILGRFGGIVKPKEILRNTTKKMQQSPWRTLAYAVGIAFVAGVVSSKILEKRNRS